jgi:hypothetical protein
MMYQIALLTLAILVGTLGLTANNTDTYTFKYYRQVRVHERFTGLSIAEPVHDASYRHFSLSLQAKQYHHHHHLYTISHLADCVGAKRASG